MLYLLLTTGDKSSRHDDGGDGVLLYQERKNQEKRRQKEIADSQYGQMLSEQVATKQRIENSTIHPGDIIATSTGGTVRNLKGFMCGCDVIVDSVVRYSGPSLSKERSRERRTARRSMLM